MRRSVHSPSDRMINIRLTSELHKKLRIKAAIEDTTIRAIISGLITELFESEIQEVVTRAKEATDE